MRSFLSALGLLVLLFFGKVALVQAQSLTMVVGEKPQMEELPARSFGLSANVQQSEFGITLPIFFTQKFVLAPSFGFTHAAGIGTDLAVGIIPRYYFTRTRFAPYLTGRVGSILNFGPPLDGNNRRTRKDWLAGVGFGGEYFLSPNFSFGVEAQGTFTVSDQTSNRFGNAGNTTFNLGNAVTANIYFLRK